MNNLNYKIVVTGATGFLGRHLIKKLVKIYNKNNILCLVLNIDNPLEKSGREILKKLGVSVKYVNLATGEGLSNLPKNPRLVFHLAAETDTSKSNHGVNNIGIKNLYKGIGPVNNKTHFIHIGTMIEVAGRPNCRDPIDEDSPDYPTNEYTRTKLEGEKFITNKCIKDKFRLTVVRPNTIYGKGVRDNSLFDMVRKMVRKNSIVTRINWPGKSALIHVEDLSNIIIRLSKERPYPGMPVKYLSYSENLSIFDISKIIHKKLKIKFKPIIIPSLIWNLFKKLRTTIPFFETFLPASLYNYLWRFGIIIDDVVNCGSRKLLDQFSEVKPRKFEDSVNDILL